MKVFKKKSLKRREKERLKRESRRVALMQMCEDGCGAVATVRTLYQFRPDNPFKFWWGFRYFMFCRKCVVKNCKDIWLINEIKNPCIFPEYKECEFIDAILDENGDVTCEECPRFVEAKKKTYKGEIERYHEQYGIAVFKKWNGIIPIEDLWKIKNPRWRERKQ